MITYANQSMKSALVEIWQESFGDSKSYIDFFYDNNMHLENTIVYIEEDKPLCMFTLIPAGIMVGGKYKKVFYEYALATAKSARGKGIATKVIEAIIEFAEKENALLILKAGSRSLVNFYKEKGYYSTFYNYMTYVNYKSEYKALVNDFVTYSISSKDYKNIRDLMFLDIPYIIWDESALEYAISENSFNGGFMIGWKCKTVKGENLNGAIFAYKEELNQCAINKLGKNVKCTNDNHIDSEKSFEERTLVIREFIGNVEKYDIFISIIVNLLNEYKIKSAKVYTGKKICLIDKNNIINMEQEQKWIKTNTGMIYNYKDINGYLAFTLD
jgi:Acetyltransferase (GNAT) family.